MKRHVRSFLWEAFGIFVIVAAIFMGLALFDGLRLVGEQFTAPVPTATPTLTSTPTSTVTPTATLTVTPTSTSVPERVRVTWYGEAFRGGPLYCGTDIYGRFDPDDPSTVAMGADGPSCGSRLRLCFEDTCITATVKDKCGGCDTEHLDLSRAAWDALGRPSEVDMTILEVYVPPAPEHTHALAPATSTGPPAAAITGGNFAALPLPANTTVVYGGCAGDGTCYPYNFYWAPTHEAVLTDPSEQGANQETHELCHAHQHWSINGGAAVPPSDYDLGSWYGTAEGQSFTAAVAGLSFPWMLSAENGLEDFAWTCTNWYRSPQRLLDVGGAERYEWARANLP